jgi:hypothetical protein
MTSRLAAGFLLLICLGFTARPQEHPPSTTTQAADARRNGGVSTPATTPPKWQFKTLFVGQAGVGIVNVNTLETTLDEMGQKGWDVAGTFTIHQERPGDVYVVILKRPKS